MLHKTGRLTIWIPLVVTLLGLALMFSILPSSGKAKTSNPADFSSSTPPTQTQREPLGGIPSATVIETFPNSWHGSAVGLVYNPTTQAVRYAHEGQAADPNTIWDIAFAPPHGTLLGINLATLNGGWPVSLNDRDGVEYDPVANTYFLPDYQGDLSVRDDNLIEINPAGTILNAWELDGPGNDSSDGSTLNTVIDIALVPGTPNRYFATRFEGTGAVYEISLTRAGLFVPATWSTIGTFALPSGDNLGIDYDAEHGLLYHSSFSDEIITVTDLSFNVIDSFICDGPGTFHTGVTYIEGSTPSEVWVTDFGSNSTTRCSIPSLTLAKTVGLGTDCAVPAEEIYPGMQVTYCYEATNTSGSITDPITFTTHTLIDDQLGTIFSNLPYTLTPGASYSATVTTILTQTTTNVATWTALDSDNNQGVGTASATVAVLNSPPSLCTTYESTDVPVFIPSNATVTSTLSVSDVFTLFDVNATLSLNHTWDADLILTLIGPNGDTILLSNQRGGNGDNYLGTIFDSQANLPISAGTPPFTGRYQPESSLNVLNGQNSNGTWTLQMQDIATGDQGNLTAWSVELCEPPVGGVELTETVGTTPSECAATDTIGVLPGTDVYFCYELTNTGNYTLTLHTLNDTIFGALLTDVYYPLGPGESVNTVDLGLNVTRNITVATTTSSNWFAEVPGFISADDSSAAFVSILNAPPAATDDEFNTVEDTPLEVAAPGVLGNDVDSDVLTATLETGTLNGTLVLSLDGSFVYTPTENYQGTDTFTYIASDGVLTDTALVTITISSVNDPPLVDAGTNQTVDEGEVVNFSGSYFDPGLFAAGRDFSGGVAIHWDFGDGATATGTLTPTHSYADNSVYTVTLTVTDTEGAAVQDWLWVTVNNVAPSVDAGADISTTVGTEVDFSGQLTDPGADTYTIAWDFGNGVTVTGTLTPSYTFMLPGDYTVTLTVTDDDGGIDTDTLVVHVAESSGNPYKIYLPTVHNP